MHFLFFDLSTITFTNITFLLKVKYIVILKNNILISSYEPSRIVSYENLQFAIYSEK